MNKHLWPELQSAGLYGVFRRALPRLQERRFVRLWSLVLTDSAGVYTGLYAGMARLSEGRLKNAVKLLGEWHDRTRFRGEEAPVARLCAYTLKPDLDGADGEACAKWARLILAAAEQAGVVRDASGTIVLDERSVNAYIEWDGETLYIGDRVSIMDPAWYQNGKLLEQGHCRLAESPGGEPPA